MNEITKHIIYTYNSLRFGVAGMGLIFPFLLWFGGLGRQIKLQQSMSAYYYAGKSQMRDWFVGFLFAIGAILFLYKGYTSAENILLNISGVLAWCVALFPTRDPDAPPTRRKFSMHGFCAVGFFIGVAIVCIWLSDQTLGYVQDEKTRHFFYAFYKLLGWSMLLLPALAFVLLSSGWGRLHRIFFVEAAAVWVFAAFWMTKSIEIGYYSKTDERGVRNAMKLVEGSALKINAPFTSTETSQKADVSAGNPISNIFRDTVLVPADPAAINK
jgi:hypothetical protein